ncbi:hypothetical protein [Thiobacillus denitrificans]|uniref:hypothetical protein n=1 Tax=Thiobacillus denitrificans TaxID=36861 RepID=UPI0011D0A75A|nr:hypothetical protein [Thiobacillus denitrificans]
MSRHLTLRVSQAEFDFLDRLAAEKGVTRTAAARHLLLQNIALDAIKNEVGSVINSRLAELHARLASVRQEVDQKVSRDDLAAATNYLADRIKKQG